MSDNIVMRAQFVEEKNDPAMMIRMRVAPYLSEIRVGGRDVLVGVYKPEADAKQGSIILPDRLRDEWLYQGTAGLVLKLGPLAYQTEKSHNWFCEENPNDGTYGKPAPPKVGDWIQFDVKDTLSFLLMDQPCRYIPDQFVRGIISRPDMIR